MIFSASICPMVTLSDTPAIRPHLREIGEFQMEHEMLLDEQDDLAARPSAFAQRVRSDGVI